MKIKTPLIDVKDQLISFIAEGCAILGHAFNNSHDTGSEYMLTQWTNKVVNYFAEVFPTQKEQGQFLYTPSGSLSYEGMHRTVQIVVNATDRRIKILENILDTLEKYYQFEPETLRLYIQQIDSFSKVRGV